MSTFFESREKAESEVKRIHQQTNEAVENGNRSVRVERLVGRCKDAMTKAIKNHDQLLELTLRADDSAFLLEEQENWLNFLTTTFDEVLKRARPYIDLLPATDKTSQISFKTTETTVSIRCRNSVTSKTPSQRHKDILIAKHRREKPERQHGSALRLAK